MRLTNREMRSLAARRRGAHRPTFQSLEDRCLLAIDLGAASPPTLPNIATNPFGVELAGSQPNGGAGFSVVDVGDVTGSGFDDFLVGAPTVTSSTASPSLGSGTATVYLIFGSASVNSGNIDWLLSTAVQRVGNLSQLGLGTQTNPINGQPGYLFNGITITTASQPGSQLGASVAAVGDINGDGVQDFVIGAPGGTDVNGNNPGTGRAYLIYGGSGLLNVPNHALNLDNTTGSGVNVVTFVNNAIGSGTGRSVGGAGDVITDGIPDIAIGAPTASIAGSVNTGAVYLVSGAALRTAQTATVQLQTVGQTNGTAGVIFVGANPLDRTGFSVAGAGDTNGAINSNNQQIGDLLIGAPGAAGNTGAAYLVNGASNLQSLATTVNGVNVIPLGQVGNTIPGAIITGTAPGDLTGFFVAAAGDFNQDGFADVLIGSPGFQLNRGQASVIYGAASGLTGTFSVGSLPSTVLGVNFIGANTGDLAGYSGTQMGQINSSVSAGFIAIGAPGFSSGMGTVYMFPYNPSDLTGNFSLSVAEQQPLAGTQIFITQPSGGGGTPAFLGASVSGRPNQSGKVTADNDTLADLIIGAPGYGALTGQGFDGGVFILEGKFIPIQAPINTGITTQIGVGQPFGPFIVNPTSPNTLSIYVFSNASVSPVFDPVVDIDPTTVVVNGVAFPNATITKDPVDENKDGIEDAIITISPRSAIGLNASTTTFTIRGRTLASSPNANKSWSGTASIVVSSTPIVPTGPVTTTNNIGFVYPTSYTPQFGPNQAVPTIAQLSAYNYKPIPRAVALEQYLPSAAYQERIKNYYNPTHKTHYTRAVEDLYGVKYRGTFTLPNNVGTRGNKFKPGHVINYTYKVPVVPANRQTVRYVPTSRKKVGLT